MKALKTIGTGIIAAAAFAGAAQAQNYPYAPQPYIPSGPSPLVSEGQLQSLGCYPTGNRDFRRGQIEYQCNADVLQRIQPSGNGAGPRCSFAGAGDRYTYSVRFVCRENVQNYDWDDPRPGRDYRVVPNNPHNPYDGGGYVVPPSGRYYDERNPRNEWRQDGWGWDNRGQRGNDNQREEKRRDAPKGQRFNP